MTTIDRDVLRDMLSCERAYAEWSAANPDADPKTVFAAGWQASFAALIDSGVIRLVVA